MKKTFLIGFLLILQHVVKSQKALPETNQGIQYNIGIEALGPNYLGAIDFALDSKSKNHPSVTNT